MRKGCGTKKQPMNTKKPVQIPSEKAYMPPGNSAMTKRNASDFSKS